MHPLEQAIDDLAIDQLWDGQRRGHHRQQGLDQALPILADSVELGPLLVQLGADHLDRRPCGFGSPLPFGHPQLELPRRHVQVAVMPLRDIAQAGSLPVPAVVGDLADDGDSPLVETRHHPGQTTVLAREEVKISRAPPGRTRSYVSRSSS